jgi:hypothetical protein
VGGAGPISDVGPAGGPVGGRVVDSVPLIRKNSSEENRWTLYSFNTTRNGKKSKINVSRRNPNFWSAEVAKITSLLSLHIGVFRATSVASTF